jgi:cytochrome d ubiquinol oxidase subunit II
MFGNAELCALVMLGALILYALFGGADFGGGVWDLLATGPRAPEQRRAIERAIAPVWEANHVWLILVVVVLFTAFPPAFSAISIALHVPLTLMLVGIVMRGSAFVFRQYGGGGDVSEQRWGRVFAAASTGTPIFLGIIVAKLTSGEPGWLDPFPIFVGFFTLSLFAFLAAVFLTNETTGALQEDFRRRALVAGVAVAAFALASGLAAGPQADRFASRLIGSWWSWPIQIATGVAALTAFAGLIRRRPRVARGAAIAQVSLILAGWGAAQYPILVAPSLTIADAAAPEATLRLLVPALVAGSFLLFPSLYWLLRVFKSDRERPQ